MKNYSPASLAKYIDHILTNSKSEFPRPDLQIITDLFECLYYASMQTEEGDWIKVNIVFENFNNTSDASERKSDLDDWSFNAFSEPIPLSVKNIVKLSKAADPWSSCLAVYFDNEKRLWINGMIDQAIHIQSYYNHEIDRKPNVPGIFQVNIIGVGSLSVLFEYELIATLRQNSLVTKFVDVLRFGPVAEQLKANARVLKEKLNTDISYLQLNREHSYSWNVHIDNVWRNTISRLLIQIKNYHHGGAILISDSKEGLDVKYNLVYNRLSIAMFNFIKSTLGLNLYNSETPKSSEDKIDFEKYLEGEWDLRTRQIATNELKGAIRFVASQSCVDGLVLLNHKLEALGFGTIIKNIDLPQFVYQSETNKVKISRLIKKNPDLLGTRHRSMMSYCWNYPGSIGFVISQDGEIRAFMRVEDKLIMWENIKTLKYIKSKNITRYYYIMPPRD